VSKTSGAAITATQYVKTGSIKVGEYSSHLHAQFLKTMATQVNKDALAPSTTDGIATMARAAFSETVRLACAVSV